MQKIKVMFLLVFLLLGMTACHEKVEESVSLEPIQSEEEQETEEDEQTDKQEYLFVYVCGAVCNEGVYQLPVGSRVFEAIEAAGGFRDDAEKKAINQAELLQDEDCIYVPVIGETVQSDAEENGKVNINKATKEELMTLPGVGESRADSIIQYRENYGAFRTIEDIMQVSGIKEGLFEKIKDLITV